MNKLLILPITSILILGCSPNKEAKAIEYDYSDVADLTICWNDILSVESDKYFAYIYSRTCGHCNEIKQDVITYALVNKVGHERLDAFGIGDVQRSHQITRLGVFVDFAALDAPRVDYNRALEVTVKEIDGPGYGRFPGLVRADKHWNHAVAGG